MRVAAVTLSAIAIIYVIACRSAEGQSEKPDSIVEEAFRAGNALIGAGKPCDALARYREGLNAVPGNPSLLYNGGVAAYECRQFDTAARLWNRLKGIDPADWETRAKLIQTYQALGHPSGRDRERSELFDLWKNGTVKELSQQVEFCRDQFEAGGEKVMAFEEFELKGSRAVRYVFSILNTDGSAEKYRLSLGSYDATNALWHETTKPKPKDTDRLFHLDGYYKWGHATYGMYFPEPSYDETRKLVVEILEKKRQPLSTSTRIPQK